MAKRLGRRSIFRGKWQGGKEGHTIARRLSAALTLRGWEKIEEHRTTLADIAERPASAVSDSDVVEYLARGVTETRRELKNE